MPGCWTVVKQSGKMGKALAVWRMCAECGGKALAEREVGKVRGSAAKVKESVEIVQGNGRSGM